MKHTFKKLFSILAAFMMVVGLGLTTVKAAGETNTGTITLTGTTAGKKYDLFKVFDATVANPDADKPAVAYTINEKWETFFATAPGSNYLVATNTGTLSPITVEGTTKYINITDSNASTFANDAHAYAAANVDKKVDQKVADGTSVQFTGLAPGYYLIYPEDASGKLEGQASICNLNTLTGKDISVAVKATYPTIGKTVDVVNPEIGQNVNYTITGNVPDTTGLSEYLYKVTDTMTAGLTFKKDVQVTIGGTAVTGLTPVYTDNGFELTIPMISNSNAIYNAGDSIIITYSATVNENAVSQVSANNAVLEYGRNPQESNKNTPAIAKVYNAKIVINKKNESGESLAGATFALYRTKEDGSTKEYYKLSKANVLTWVDSVDQATKYTTSDTGIVNFIGLKNGTYFIEETNAPQGYNKLPAPVEVKINGNADATLTDLTETKDITNTHGSSLPSTGGVGTTLMYTVGGLLVAGAAVAFVTKKRMNA